MQARMGAISMTIVAQLSRNACRICGQEGHWGNECPFKDMGASLLARGGSGGSSSSAASIASLPWSASSSPTSPTQVLELKDVNVQQLKSLAAKMLQQKRDEFAQCAELAKRIAAGMMKFFTPKLTVATFSAQDPSFGTPTKPVPDLTVKLIQKSLQNRSIVSLLH